MGFRSSSTAYPREGILEIVVRASIIQVLTARQSDFAHKLYIIAVKFHRGIYESKRMSERYSVFAWKKTWTLLEEDTAETPGAVAFCMYHAFHPSFLVHQTSTNCPSLMRYIRSVMSPDVSSTAVRCAPSGTDP